MYTCVYRYIYISVQSFSRVQLFSTPWTAAHQASPCINNSWSLLMSMSWWWHPIISSSVALFSSCPAFRSFLASGYFPMSQFFTSGGRWGLKFQLQHQSFQWIFRTDFLKDWLAGFPCSSRDSQESFPTPQFKSINSLALSFLYSPTLTSI